MPFHASDADCVTGQLEKKINSDKVKPNDDLQNVKCFDD